MLGYSAKTYGKLEKRVPPPQRANSRPVTVKAMDHSRISLAKDAYKHARLSMNEAVVRKRPEAEIDSILDTLLRNLAQKIASAYIDQDGDVQ